MKLLKLNDNVIVLDERNNYHYIFPGIFLFFGLMGFSSASYGNIVFAIFSGLFFSIIGFAILLFMSPRKCIFDKNQGELIIDSSSLIKRREEFIDLKDIKEIELKIEYGDSNDYYLIFKIENSNDLDIHLGSFDQVNPLSKLFKNNYKDTSMTVANFLNLPLKENKPDKDILTRTIEYFKK